MSQPMMNRRAFLGAAAVAAGAVLSPRPVLAGIGWESDRRRDGREEITRTEFLMGTFVTATACDASPDRTHEALEAAFTEVRRLCGILDRRLDGAEARRLNETGSLRGAHPELAAVARAAADMHRLTAGAFDPTVLPVLELLEHSVGPDGRIRLDRAEEARALRLVDGSALRVEGRDVRLERPGMSLTLDGVGKGYVVDRACEAMAAVGVESCLVNAGGDIRCMGPRTWTIAVEDPGRANRYPSLLRLRDAALATSGGYERPLDASGAHNHVLIPGTGLSPTRTLSTSAVAATAMEADALSTALFVMHPRSALRLVGSLPGRECLVLAADGARLVSSGWSRLERV